MKNWVLGAWLVIVGVFGFSMEGRCAYQLLGQADGVHYTWDGTLANRLLPETPGSYQFDYDAKASVPFNLPWLFPYDGQNFSQITARGNGSMQFGNGPVLAAWNADLSSYYTGGVFVQHKQNPERVVIEWVTETLQDAASGRKNTFAVVLDPTGGIRVDYQGFGNAIIVDNGSGLTSDPNLSITGTYGPVSGLEQTSFLFLNNPTADGDNDQLDNLHEYLAGTNPAVADTDGDGALDGRDLDPLDTALGSIAVALGTTSIDNEASAVIPVTIETASSGSQFSFSQVIDLNGNGMAELGEPVIREFRVTDGIASTNANVPGDNEVVNGTIGTWLDFGNRLDRYHAPGEYVLVVSDGVETVETAFTVTPVIYPQTIAGTITDGANMVPGSFISATDKWGRPTGYAISDHLGNYVLNLPPGEYRLVPEAFVFATAKAASPLINLPAGGSVTADLTVTPGQFHIAGQVYDPSSANGIEGVLVKAESADYLGLALTDENGFDLHLPAGTYEIDVAMTDGASPAFKGYVAAFNQNLSIDLMSDLVGIDFPMNREPCRLRGKCGMGMDCRLRGCRCSLSQAAPPNLWPMPLPIMTAGTHLGFPKAAVGRLPWMPMPPRALDTQGTSSTISPPQPAH